MRSTKASAAVDRLKRRSGNSHYSMVRTSEGLFYLAQTSQTGSLEKISEALEQDAFVQYVNSVGPQQQKRVSKFDTAFEKQLVKKNKPDGE